MSEIDETLRAGREKHNATAGCGPQIEFGRLVVQSCGFDRIRAGADGAQVAWLGSADFPRANQAYEANYEMEKLFAGEVSVVKRVGSSARINLPVDRPSTIDAARKVVCEIRNELHQIEGRISALRESLRIAEAEVLHRSSESANLRDDILITRIADEVHKRFEGMRNDPNEKQKQYLREKEAADYVGVSVHALRRWRSKRSKNSPPYSRLGRLVLYPVAGLEEHMRARVVRAGD